MPRLYDLHGDKTFDNLNKKVSSSLKYQRLIRGPALAYLYDAVQFSGDTLELLENQESVSTKEIEQRVYEAHNTFMRVFTLMAHRYLMVQLRAGLDGAAAHKGPEALKAKLAFMEENVYNSSDGFDAEPIFNKWLQEFDSSRHRAVMNTAAKQAAKGPGGGGRFLGRERRDQGGAGSSKSRTPPNQPGCGCRKGADAGLAAGLAPEVLQWVSRGAKINWLQGPSAPFDHGVLLRDQTLTQQTWLEKEAQRHLDNGAWVAQCFLSAVEMQDGAAEETATHTLLAKQNDWCFPFDLKDGYHRMGIDPDFEKSMGSGIQSKLRSTWDWRCPPRHARAAQDDPLQGHRPVVRSFPRATLGPGSEAARFQPVYLAVPAARLYLRELYFGQETELKAGQEAARQSFGDLKCWKRLRECKWKGRKIWRCPTRAKLYTGASLYSWGGLLNLKLEARGFCEANEWATRLSRDTDIDNWKLNRHWFDWAQTEWGEHRVDRFASEISAQLPRLREEGAVVAPYWPGWLWFRKLEVIMDEVIIMPHRWDLYTPSRLGGSELLGASNWDAVMFQIPLSEKLTRPEQQQEAEESDDVALVSEWTSALREH
eukprot:gene34011-biopygen1931